MCEGIFELSPRSSPKWLPGGLSGHGELYLDGSEFQFKYVDSQQKERYGVNQDTSVELLWELLRLHEYPEAPSRFQSVFAWEHLEEARQFAGAPQQGTIWQIETEQPGFRADMSLVRAVPHTRNTLQLARMYWAQHDNYDRSGLPPQSGPPVWEYLLTPPVRVVRAVPST